MYSLVFFGADKGTFADDDRLSHVAAAGVAIRVVQCHIIVNLKMC